MSTITIDKRSALVLIDLQNGILALPQSHSQHGGEIHGAQRLGNSCNLLFAEEASTDVDAGSHRHTFAKISPPARHYASLAR